MGVMGQVNTFNGKTLDELAQSVSHATAKLNEAHVQLEAAKEKHAETGRAETAARNAFASASKAVHAARKAYDDAINIEARTP